MPEQHIKKSFENLIDALVESQHLDIMVSFNYNSFDADFYKEADNLF